MKAMARDRSDGRKALLVYLHPNLIKRLKMAALDESRPVYELTEEAVSAWLAGRAKERKRRA